MGWYLKKEIFTLSLVLGLVFTFAGCSDDGATQPPDPNIPTFANIWPAAEGVRMEFELTSQNYSLDEDYFETPEDISEIPPMEELYEELLADSGYDFSPIASGKYHLEFLEDHSDVDGTTMLEISNSIERTEGFPHNPRSLSVGPYWTLTADRISATLEGIVLWVALDGALEPGHSFSSDILSAFGSHLEARIWQIRSFSVMDNVYPNCVECFYVVDEGVRVVRDDDSVVVGYYRPYTYGVAVYAPGVGLVYGKEKTMWYVGAWEKREATLRVFEDGGI